MTVARRCASVTGAGTRCGKRQNSDRGQRTVRTFRRAGDRRHAALSRDRRASPPRSRYGYFGHLGEAPGLAHFVAPLSRNADNKDGQQPAKERRFQKIAARDADRTCWCGSPAFASVEPACAASSCYFAVIKCLSMPNAPSLSAWSSRVGRIIWNSAPLVPSDSAESRPP